MGARELILNGSNKGLFSHHKRIKEKIVKDKDYLQWFAQQNLGCIICGIVPADGHHVYSVLHGVKRNHTKLIPLCEFHHRHSVDCSPHAGKKGFFEMFSLDNQLFLADKIYKMYLDEKKFKQFN